MATRNQTVVSQQQRGGVVLVPAPAPKQQNRRAALVDIGNRVAGTQQPHPTVNRPITRSFGAQLLAQAAAASKKPVTLPSDPAIQKAVAPRPGTKKGVNVNKPKQGKENATEIIQISSDPDKGKKPMSISPHVKASNKKKIQSLTSVLTARSKIACGITGKPKEPLEDIDAADVGDQFAVVEYVEDMYKFYKEAENTCRPRDYMGSQVEITPKMRAILTDWLIEVHHRFELMPETLYLTVCIIDRYLSKELILRRQLQLVGMCAMLIACKYEEIWAPEVNDFIHISDRAYNRQEVLAMEKQILNKLEWYLTVPTPYVFLVRFIKAAGGDKEMGNMVFFFAELGLMQYNLIKFVPSMLAASAVYAARCTLKKTPLWTETLKRHTGFSEPELLECAGALVSAHSAAPEEKLRVIYKKYSHEMYGGVALRSPAAKMIEDLKSDSTNKK